MRDKHNGITVWIPGVQNLIIVAVRIPKATDALDSGASGVRDLIPVAIRTPKATDAFEFGASGIPNFITVAIRI